MAEDNGTTMNYRFTARGGLDEKVHLVNAPVAAIAHPSAHTTWCGQPVVNICRDGLLGSRAALPIPTLTPPVG